MNTVSSTIFTGLVAIEYSYSFRLEQSANEFFFMHKASYFWNISSSPCHNSGQYHFYSVRTNILTRIPFVSSFNKTTNEKDLIIA